MNRASTILKSIINVIGNITMGTTATTVTGAIAEHETQINNIVSNEVKWGFFSTGSQSWSPGTSTYTVDITSDISGYTKIFVGARVTSVYLSIVWAISGSRATIYVYNPRTSAVTATVNGYTLYLSNSHQVTS